MIKVRDRFQSDTIIYQGPHYLCSNKAFAKTAAPESVMPNPLQEREQDKYVTQHA
jgi:hypothetical protein